MRKLLLALALMPLAACFDADMTFTVEDSDNAKMHAVMSMGPELYGMIAASGEDPCEEGVGEVLADGGYTCTIEESDTIDNIIAELNEGVSEDSENPMDMGEGFALERLENGNIKVAFDLGSMNDDMAEQGMDPQMMAGMMQAFTGRQISITVVGPEVVETNGVLADDGKSASMVIPLTKLFAPENDLPDSFDVVINPN
ncbi:hypothetical protein XMM379_001673 [Aliiroseovarius sp. xm-m-379]|uniref:hypothetical protein n=1 Tax=unclassified Aliiroseovarius TaxID=2623558 RepID=UPI001568C525|nr:MULTISPECIES: hypothetical protein [unclassified Aliiroseovarius]NRP13645.1 hypothetical protein [Aliiroseovarius sp. xm-d-517]NRP24983.1 hypothetical protein [Aliiroseovarius sp. xm-m-379]NRP31496.1 hypothetical protein [Aliiroseovarius sp. xm-m-314]NRP33782.1 hypothetical protein [Aliiroseovarius sp. xm-a-104]NRP41215.1 hypothetical protein [Aliiroseovarius sp. xm-m-339-2]